MSIKTNKENFPVIRHLTELYLFPNDSIIAKIALNYTLQLNKRFELADHLKVDNTGKEYQEDALFGGRINYDLYRALFNQHYGCILESSDFTKLVKLHLDAGIEKLKTDILDNNQGRNAHIDYLLSIIKRGTNLITDEKNVPFAPVSAPQNSTAGYKDLIEFNLGMADKDEIINIRLNDLYEFESHHIAIAGTTGSGKTELIKDLLYQIAQKTNQQLKFIFFDYKGEGQSDKLKPFLDKTNCEYVNPIEKAFDFNPLSFIHLTNEKQQIFNINSFVDAVAAIDSKLGAKQKNLLKTITMNCFDKKKKEGKYPTLNYLFDELKNYYHEIDEKPDSLYAIMSDLATNLFAEDIPKEVGKIYEKSIYMSLPEAMSDKLRQLCVFLTLKYLLSVFSSMDDVVPNDKRINPIRYIIVIDETHIYLNNKNARSILEQLLRVIRSKGVVVVMLSQGVEDFYKPDFDFSSQVKIPICLYVKNKQAKPIERFVGSVRHSGKFQKIIDDLDKGNGLINFSEPKLFKIRQFWQTNR